VIEDQLKAEAVRVAGGVRDVAQLHMASRDPALAGSLSLGQGVMRWQARRSVAAAPP
jgi:hypothetical protein